jgi:asparagine synthase (glutamine-hydrolysing)
MCGLAGLFTSHAATEAELRDAACGMIGPIRHRGPDDDGIWTDASAGVALGFRRLAILDLSALGHQPMRSATGRFTIIFNGEVYNHAELRRELEAAGHRFRGHSDTETMLAAYEQWGVERATRRFVGMFAIALWDHAERTLHLVRDRLGIKPLYVWHQDGELAFASELKSLVALPRFDRSLDYDAVVAYLRYLYVPAPLSIFRWVRKLEPGNILSIRDPGKPLPASVPYWALTEVAQEGLANPLTGSDEELVEQADALLTHAVALRMLADVPVGALLSGGVDSSTVVALMQASASQPVRTFTIGFPDQDYNEASHAAAIARHIGTAHTELVLTTPELEAVVPRVPELFDEPLADPSQIPTYLVCQLARREVTVALSGDGGDEVFAGYNRYVKGTSVLRAAARLPRAAKRLVGGLIGRSDAASLNRWSRRVGAVLPARLRDARLGEKAYKLRLLARSDGAASMYRSLVSFWQDPAALVPGGREPQDAVNCAWAMLGGASDLDRMILADQLAYLPDDLLAKVDRASMAVSLEARVPLLDHRVVEFAWRLPGRTKVRRQTGKWILRQVLYRRVPPSLIERPKMGFSVPIEAWLRGPLREWAGDLLAADRVRGAGVLDPDQVAAAWRAFDEGSRGPAGLDIWALLVFRAWQNRWTAAPARVP